MNKSIISLYNDIVQTKRFKQYYPSSTFPLIIEKENDYSQKPCEIDVGDGTGRFSVPRTVAEIVAKERFIFLSEIIKNELNPTNN